MAIEPLIHIGYHKTGSSWLQRFVFSAKAGAGFMRFSKGRAGPINTLIVSPNPLDFDPDAARQTFAGLVGDAAERGLRPVISSERLSGHPFTGGYDSKELAERLATTLPDGRVLIVIREQREMLLSTYRQYVRAGGVWSLGQFLDPPVDTRTRVRLFDSNHFAYHRLIETYQRLFGEERVLVLPYELLRSEPGRFVTQIAHFAGVPLPAGFVESMPVEARPNLAGSSAAARAKRVLNRLFARSDLHPAPLIDAPRLEALARRRIGAVDRLVPGFLTARLERRDRDRVIEHARGRFELSNCATSALCGLDLAVHGYSTAAEADSEPAGRHAASVGA
jgi:hypothetical protein